MSEEKNEEVELLYLAFLSTAETFDEAGVIDTDKRYRESVLKTAARRIVYGPPKNRMMDNRQIKATDIKYCQD